MFFTIFAFIGGIFGFILKAADLLKPEVRQGLGKWLSNQPSKRNFKDPIIWFNEAFDNFFGTKHFSEKCFVRSAAVSIVLSIIFRVVLDIYTEGTDYIYSTENGLSIKIPPHFVTGTLYETIFFDFVSLLVTRWFLKKCINSSFRTKVFFAIIDISIAFLIAFIGILFEYTNYELVSIESSFKNIEPAFDALKSQRWQASLGKLKAAFFLETNQDMSHAQWIYSTFFTTIWVFIYILSSGVIKLLNLTRNGHIIITRYFDLENKPFQVIAYFIWVISVIFFCLGYFL